MLHTTTSDGLGLVGYGVAVLRGPDGRVKSVRNFRNLITDAGDLYYASKAIVGVAPASPSAPTVMSGMKLGTGTTAASKAGSGAALVTYLSGSNAAFSATYPKTSNLGSGLGVEAQYACSWAAGVATGNITEAVIVNDAGTNATSTAANTIARVTFTAVPKAAADVFELYWYHKVLGV
jgi:hypothetical protein